MAGYFDPSSVSAVCTHGSNWYQRSKGTTYALFGLLDHQHHYLTHMRTGSETAPGELTIPFAGLSLVSSVTTLK